MRPGVDVARGLEGGITNLLVSIVIRAVAYSSVAVFCTSPQPAKTKSGTRKRIIMWSLIGLIIYGAFGIVSTPLWQGVLKEYDQKITHFMRLRFSEFWA